MTTSTAAMASTTQFPFPGRPMRKGAPAGEEIRRLRERLHALGCWPHAAAAPDVASGEFDATTEQAVKLFQARFADLDGVAMKVDGVVGPITWARLFAAGAPATTSIAPAELPAPTPLLRAVLDVARAQIGVMEAPPGSNRGPQVDEFVRRVGLDPGGEYPWCAAFVYWCFAEAAARVGVQNSAVKTAGAVAIWTASKNVPGVQRISTKEASLAPGLIEPGMVFVLSTGGGRGHTGIVEGLVDGKLVTIEGNTNSGGSRNGIGVFRLKRRTIASINLGFVRYP